MLALTLEPSARDVQMAPLKLAAADAVPIVGPTSAPATRPATASQPTARYVKDRRRMIHSPACLSRAMMNEPSARTMARASWGLVRGASSTKVPLFRDWHLTATATDILGPQR